MPSDNGMKNQDKRQKIKDKRRGESRGGNCKTPKSAIRDTKVNSHRNGVKKIRVQQYMPPKLGNHKS